MLLVVVLIEIKSNGNQRKFENNGFYAPPFCPFVGAIPLDRTEGSLCLNRTVDSEGNSQFGFQIGYHFLMDFRQLRMHPYCPVSASLGAFGFLLTSFAALAFVYFLRSAVAVPLWDGHSHA